MDQVRKGGHNNNNNHNHNHNHHNNNNNNPGNNKAMKSPAISGSPAIVHTGHQLSEHRCKSHTAQRPAIHRLEPSILDPRSGWWLI